MNYCRCIIFCCMIAVLSPSLVFAAKSHKVRKKETLYSLARKYRVSVDDLKSSNNIVKNSIKPGDVLVIPPHSVEAEPKTAARSKEANYRIRKGDTLARIAKKSGTTVAELQRLNGLKKARVKPGQFIVLKQVERDDDVKRSARAYRPTRSYRNVDLFREDEYERTLAELTSPDPGKPVDLSAAIQLKPKLDGTAALKKSAYSFLGARYRFGGSSRTSLDCSSFVQQVFRELDVNLPRTAREQFGVGEAVLPGELQKGDLVFFHTYARYPSHVGIYLGENRMIHASSRDRRVVISAMNTPYYLSRFIGAKRISKVNPNIFDFSDLFTGAEIETEDDVLANDTLGIAGN
jgi:peptidoglycan DL-endopeptidase LytE